MSIYCSKCGAEVPEDVNFCPKCGAVIAKIIEEENKGVQPTEKIGLPKFWIGYIIAVIFFITEVGITIINPVLLEETPSPVLVCIALVGLIYWFFCVYRIHKVLAQITSSAYPITPKAAVGYCFVPFYNLYWIYKWPMEMARFVRINLGQKSIINPKLIGLLAFLTPVVGLKIDSSIQMVILFSIGVYLSHKIKQVILAKPSKEGNSL